MKNPGQISVEINTLEMNQRRAGDAHRLLNVTIEGARIGQSLQLLVFAQFGKSQCRPFRVSHVLPRLPALLGQPVVQSSEIRPALATGHLPDLTTAILYVLLDDAPWHTTKRKTGRVYRYYVSQRDLKEHAGASGLPRLPAAELESAVLEQLRGLLRSPGLIANVVPKAKALSVGEGGVVIMGLSYEFYRRDHAKSSDWSSSR